MSGVAKRKYQSELIQFAKDMKKPLVKVALTLKPDYTKEDLLYAFREYYPFMWKMICEMMNEYKEKDMFLKEKKGRTRYNTQSPEEYFYSLEKVKHILSNGYKKNYKINYDEEVRLEKTQVLKKEREIKNWEKQRKIDNYTKDMQRVAPEYLDVLIYAYHDRKNTTNDKMEIFKEIQKFDCDEAWRFFSRINDCENNNQIRRLAFEHLQNGGHYARLRKKFEGNEKIYQIERSTFYGTPEALAMRLNDSQSVQNKMRFDLFISHSYKDKDYVRMVERKANDQGLLCYVDWSSDNEFLKRPLVSNYTWEVLKARMMQSKNLLYLSSDESRNSDWVAQELDYYLNEVKGKIYMVVVDGNDDHDFKRIEDFNFDNLS